MGNGFELELGAEDRTGTAGMDGREIMVGLRPEYLRDTPREGSGATARVRFKVELVETLGHEILVHGHLGETPWWPRWPRTIVPRSIPRWSSCWSSTSCICSTLPPSSI